MDVSEVKWSESHLVVSNSLQPHGLYRWNSPGQNAGVGSLSLLQRIFSTQGLNPGLPHCKWILYQLSLKGSPWMWELDYKESWAPKNWCFWTVMLENILESPLECKESKPVSLKGNQSWIFIGRTDAEAEILILWPPDGKNWLTGKDPDAGKDWRQDEKGTTEDEMVGWHRQLDGHEFEQTPGDNEGQGGLACCSPGGRKGSDPTWGPNSNREGFKDQGSRVKGFLLLWRSSHPQLLGVLCVCDWFCLKS